MFPVLQVSKVKNLSDVGHYFLLVLNIRNARFEVLDSMRTLEDTNLRTCCDKLMEAIKKLWSEHYPDSKVQIQNYEAISIAVPQQNNKYTPFFLNLFFMYQHIGRQAQFIEQSIAICHFLLFFCSHDCGFHMLMHAEHWDVREACNFSHKDMPNI
jgi:Ulp1 family protease